MVYNASMVKRYLLIVIILLFALSLWGIVHTLNVSAPEQSSGTTTPPVDVPAAVVQQQNDQIVVNSPVSGQVVLSPFKVTGQARGNWYFEGSFPITLTTLDGTVIASTAAQAQGNWMTTDYVPFVGILSFAPAPAANGPTYGYIVLKNDNPSGNPQFDKSVSIKVQW